LQGLDTPSRQLLHRSFSCTPIKAHFTCIPQPVQVAFAQEGQSTLRHIFSDYQAQEEEEEVAYEDDDEPLARIASYESCEDEVNLDELDFSEDIQQESEELELDESMKFIWITKVSSELNPKTAARSIRAFGVRCGIKFAKNKTDTAILLSCETAKDAHILNNKLNGELCGNIVDICVQDSDLTRRKTLIDLTNEDKNDELAALMKKIEVMDKTISDKRKTKNQTQEKYRTVRQEISRLKRNIDRDLESAVKYTREKRDSENRIQSMRRSIRDYRDEKRSNESKQKRLVREKAETKAKLVTARNKMNKALEEERQAMKETDARETLEYSGGQIRISVPNEPDYLPEPDKFESEYAKKKMAASEPVGVTRTIPNEDVMPSRRSGPQTTRGGFRGARGSSYSGRGSSSRGRGGAHFRTANSRGGSRGGTRGRGAPRGGFMPSRTRKFQEPQTY
jgi:myosin heavy subunit